MTRPLVVGNWKMNGGQSDCLQLARKIVRQLKTKPPNAQVVLAPPFTGLLAVGKALRNTALQLAAQNCHWELGGAFTGEISPSMLQELACQFVILGHSERRHILRESDEMVAQKVMPVISQGMRPIVCVGETLAERGREETFAVIGRQLHIALKGLDKDAIQNLEIAYEPVWAIGTGRNATPEQIREVHAKIRELLGASFGGAITRKLRILYGGSVKPENAPMIADTDEVDGFLVGGASLQADSFAAIARAFI